MITVEEQVRRYAVDVAGPLRHPTLVSGEPPGAKATGTRVALLVALAMFLLGVGYALLVPGDNSDQPAADQPSTSLVPSELVSSAGGVGTCGNTNGVLFVGAAGDGLCIGVGDSNGDGLMALNTVDGSVQGGSRYMPCAVLPAGSLRSSSGTAGSGGASTFWTTSLATAYLVVPLSDGSSLRADTVILPGVSGARFAASWLPDGVEVSGPPQQFSEAGDLVTSETPLPSTPESCTSPG